MKSNFFKYLFFIFVIGLIIYSVYIIRKNEETTKMEAINNSDSEIEVEDVKNIRLGIANLDTMNPILSKNKYVQDVSKIIFDSLLTLDKDYKLQPNLAKEWSKTSDTTYILKLRNDVTWQNGEKFTSNDVKYTIDRLKDTESVYGTNVQYVVGLEIIDEYTLKITLAKEVPFFEYNLVFPILSEKYFKDEDFTKTEKNKMIIGTGMYKIAEIADGKIKLTKNENWWGLKEKSLMLDDITINLYSSTGEMYNAFKLGNIDIVSTSNLNIEKYIGTIGFNSKEFKGREYDFLALNTNNELLQNKEVRQAISHAIDRDNIVSSVFKDKYYKMNFSLDYGSWAFSGIENFRVYNQDSAKQILVDNGWEYSYKYWRKYKNHKTLRLTFNLVTNANNTDRVQVAELIKTQLENIGIKINIIKASDDQYKRYLENKNYDMILTGTNVSMAPDLTTYFGDGNLANYKNDEITDLINELKNITEEELFKEKIKKIYEIYLDEVPYISLYTNRNTVAYSQNLFGSFMPNCFNIFYGIEDWHR